MDTIGGHMAAIAITLVAKLRGKGWGKELRAVVSDSDAYSIDRFNEPFTTFLR